MRTMRIAELETFDFYLIGDSDRKKVLSSNHRTCQRQESYSI